MAVRLASLSRINKPTKIRNRTKNSKKAKKTAKMRRNWSMKRGLKMFWYFLLTFQALLTKNSPKCPRILRKNHCDFVKTNIKFSNFFALDVLFCFWEQVCIVKMNRNSYGSHSVNFFQLSHRRGFCSGTLWEIRFLDWRSVKYLGRNSNSSLASIYLTNCQISHHWDSWLLWKSQKHPQILFRVVWEKKENTLT